MQHFAVCHIRIARNIRYIWYLRLWHANPLRGVLVLPSLIPHFGGPNRCFCIILACSGTFLTHFYQFLAIFGNFDPILVIFDVPLNRTSIFENPLWRHVVSVFFTQGPFCWTYELLTYCHGNGVTYHLTWGIARKTQSTRSLPKFSTTLGSAFHYLNLTFFTFTFPISFLMHGPNLLSYTNSPIPSPLT